MEEQGNSVWRVPAKTVRELSQRSDFRGALHTASHLAALGVSTTALWLTWGTWISVPLFMVQGTLLAFLYAGVHELSHWTVFKTKRLNDFFGALFGFLIFVPRDFDRFEHFEHHRYTQNPELDAEIAGRKPFTLGTYLLYFLGPSYWFNRFRTLFRTAAGRVPQHYLSPTLKAHVIREARWYVAGYAAIAALSIYYQRWEAVTLWIAPLLTMKFMHQMQNITEHTGMPYVSDILQSTRTIRTNALMRWLAWNMPYHTAHHMYPSVPFFALPKLHAEVVRRIGQEPETISYLGFQKHMLRKLLRDGHSAYAGRPIHSY